MAFVLSVGDGVVDARTDCVDKTTANEEDRASIDNVRFKSLRPLYLCRIEVKPTKRNESSS